MKWKSILIADALQFVSCNVCSPTYSDPSYKMPEVIASCQCNWIRTRRQDSHYSRVFSLFQKNRTFNSKFLYGPPGRGGQKFT